VNKHSQLCDSRKPNLEEFLHAYRQPALWHYIQDTYMHACTETPYPELRSPNEAQSKRYA
jgi:hypothetical protein